MYVFVSTHRHCVCSVRGGNAELLEVRRLLDDEEADEGGGGDDECLAEEEDGGTCAVGDTDLLDVTQVEPKHLGGRGGKRKARYG